MKPILATLLLALGGGSAIAQTNVGINNASPDPSAALDVKSTTQGMLVPRMDSAQRSLISAPATGLLVYQTNGVTPGFYYYNGTAWTSLSSAPGGSTTLPSQAGNAGKVLTTDGTSPSWGIGIGASYEVYATITTAQTTSVGSNTALPDAIYFGSNTSPASLTGGNTFSNVTVSSPNTSTANASQTTSRFTAGVSGLYFVDIQLAADGGGSVASIPMLDFNGTGNSASSSYGIAFISNNTLQSPRRARGMLQHLIYMNVGDYFYVRAASTSTVVVAQPSADASNYIRIVKLR